MPYNLYVFRMPLVKKLYILNSVASAFPVACFGVSERILNYIIP